MPETLTVVTVLGTLVVGTPLVLLAALGFPLLLAAHFRSGRLPALSIGDCHRASGLYWHAGFDARDGRPARCAKRGQLGGISDDLPSERVHYHFSLKFEFDRLSVPLSILCFVLCGTVGAFATRYLHRESGYNRFFVLFALFLSGMVIASLADTIETLFIGWEFVGL